MTQFASIGNEAAAYALLDIAREFRARPIGHHSAALAHILSHLRAGPMQGKYCLICIRPHREWVIGRLSGVRGVAPLVEDNRVFASVEEAEWEIFRLRWNAAGLPTIDDNEL
jgi:hypothetical protein